MAEAWLNLADRLSRLLKHNRAVGEDPEIRATFRGNQLKAD
jgi:hypothetical protein